MALRVQKGGPFGIIYIIAASNCRETQQTEQQAFTLHSTWLLLASESYIPLDATVPHFDGHSVHSVTVEHVVQ